MRGKSDENINLTFPIQQQQLFSRKIRIPGTIYQFILFHVIKSPNSSFSFHLWVGDWLPYCSDNDCIQCHWNVEYPIISALDQNHFYTFLHRPKYLGSQERHILAWIPGKPKQYLESKRYLFLVHFLWPILFSVSPPFFLAHFLVTVFLGPQNIPGQEGKLDEPWPRRQLRSGRENLCVIANHILSP